MIKEVVGKDNSPDNIITPDNFGKPSRKLLNSDLEGLRQSGLIIDSELSAFDELSLSEPQYGESVLGEMTYEEVVLFTAYHDALAELEDLSRELGSQNFIRLGKAIKDRSEMDILKNPNNLLEEKDAEELFRLQRKAEYLSNMFYWHIETRFDCHDFSLGIRSKKRIVKGARKW